MAASGATKVLHLINGEFYAGAERVQDLLALQLGPCGFAVSFARASRMAYLRLGAAPSERRSIRCR
jgi:hypothetical protein